MLNAIYLGAAVLYLVASALLFVFGANLTIFALIVWRRGPKPQAAEMQPAELATLHEARLPKVTMQLPIYNELYVSRRVIEAACAIEYPSELLEIQVLDDSSDETVAVIAEVVAEQRALGVDIVHLHRTNRAGYKAGALAAGTAIAKGELVAIFDADFVPPQHFLARTVGFFERDELAFVQGRWGHLNREHSWLTKLQSLAIDGHFLVEQAGRGERGYWFNFNGTAGIWRVAAIEDAGGWTADTLTEDLDLSYRAHLRGWSGHYLEDLVVPGEVPAQMSSFRRQQHRWARGSLECAARLLPRIWASDAPRLTKFQATSHLLAYGIHLLLMVLTLIYPLVIEGSMTFPGVSTLFGLGYVFALTSLAPSIFFLVGQRQAGRNPLREIPRILVVSVFGSGLMVNTARAALEIFTKPNPEFERTAKFGIDDAETDWIRKRYQLDIDRIVIAEALLGVYSLGSAWLAWNRGNWGIFIYATVFGLGLAAVVATSVANSIAVNRSRSEREAAVKQERERWRSPTGSAEQRS